MHQQKKKKQLFLLFGLLTRLAPRLVLVWLLSNTRLCIATEGHSCMYHSVLDYIARGHAVVSVHHDITIIIIFYIIVHVSCISNLPSLLSMVP